MRKIAPVVLQQSDTECGVASLAMIFGYYKVHTPLEILRDQCAANRDGCKAQTLINVALNNGFNASAYQVDIPTVTQLSTPVIAHWKFSHYIVINYIKNNKVHINDPAFGAAFITLDEFSQSFTGVIINITPGDNVIQCKPPSQLIKLANFAIGKYTDNLFTLLCLVITLVSPYLILLTTRLILDNHSSSNTPLFLTLMLTLGLIYSIYLSSTYLYRTTQQTLISKLSMTHISTITTQLLQLPMLFYSLRHRNEIIALTLRIESLIESLLRQSLNTLTAFVSLALCMTYMQRIDYRLLAFSLSITAIYFMAHLILVKAQHSHEKQNIMINAKRHHHTFICLKNRETIHACSLQEQMIYKWQQLSSKSIETKNKLHWLATIKTILEKLYHSIMVVGVIVISSTDTQTKLIYYTLQLILHKSVSTLLEMASNLKTSHHHFSRINDIYSYKKDNRHLQSDTTIENIDDAAVVLSCDNVTFYYNEHEHPTLLDISLTIKQYQHIAFIGRTGSGKSTLAKLLCALYQSNQGSIELFGRNISTISAHHLANLCAYVSQDVSLFSGTLLENLTLGKNIASDKITQAIHTACLEHLVKERGLNATIEEGGRNFSGGEKQRIDIARALLQDTPILILDEATSALDNDTESSLINHLKNLKKTVIFVAHRLPSIEHCDQIFTLSQGKIIKHETRA